MNSSALTLVVGVSNAFRKSTRSAKQHESTSLDPPVRTSGKSDGSKLKPDVMKIGGAKNLDPDSSALPQPAHANRARHFIH